MKKVRTVWICRCPEGHMSVHVLQPKRCKSADSWYWASAWGCNSRLEGFMKSLNLGFFGLRPGEKEKARVTVEVGR